MPDLATRADVATVVDNFYKKATTDPHIGFLFEGLDLMNHLPILHDFWENILWRTGAYKGGMMYKHFMLNSRHPLQDTHFERWLELFVQTIDEHFDGPNALIMKQYAYSVANTIYERIQQQNESLLAILDGKQQSQTQS